MGKILQKLLNKDNTQLASDDNATQYLPNKGEPITFDPILDKRIEIKELQEALFKLKRNAPGPDRVLAEYLRLFAETQEDVLLKLVRQLFSKHVYPTLWNSNFLKPIYKIGDAEDPDNYRGIAIGSAFAKLFSLILLKRLNAYIENKTLISSRQIGFMKGSRTSDHIFLLQTIIEKVVKKNKGKLYAAFIDFKKAYDTIDRKKLFESLKDLGINGIFLCNIISMYNHTTYKIKLKDGYLDAIVSNLGLKQGCPLSPMLFNLYIDDIGDIFDDSCDPTIILNEKIHHFLYADDLVLISLTPDGLQRSLNKVSEYGKQKDLTISIKKSKTMIFNSTGKHVKKQFSIEGKNLESVNTFCYLGYEVKPSGSVKHAMNALHEKAKKALRPIMSAIYRFNLPVSLAIKLFHTYISPIILYNVENWAILKDSKLQQFKRTDIYDNIDTSKTDLIHRKLLKNILGVSKSCPNLAIYGETGEIPLSLKGYRLMLSYWNRLRNLPDENLAKKHFYHKRNSGQAGSKLSKT